MTTPAVGIHAHPRRKLGLIPNDPTRPRLRLASFFDAQAALQFDPQDDNLGGLDFQLYGNDKIGDCGPTDVGNGVIQTTQGKVVPSEHDVVDLYSRVSGYDPQTGERDDGVEMQLMLAELLKNGIGDGKGGTVKPVAFAALDPHDDDELEAAINVFDGVDLGATLRVAQQDQHGIWDWDESEIWGGHAFRGGRYSRSTGRIGLVSWDELFDMTPEFRAHQLDEAWVTVWPWHLTRPGVDPQALASVYFQLTGKTLVVPPSPAPVPAPPAPAPTDGEVVTAADRELWSEDFQAWAHARHTHANHDAAMRAQRWAKRKGFLA